MVLLQQVWYYVCKERLRELTCVVSDRDEEVDRGADGTVF